MRTAVRLRIVRTAARLRSVVGGMFAVARLRARATVDPGAPYHALRDVFVVLRPVDRVDGPRVVGQKPPATLKHQRCHVDNDEPVGAPDLTEYGRIATVWLAAGVCFMPQLLPRIGSRGHSSEAPATYYGRGQFEREPSAGPSWMCVRPSPSWNSAHVSAGAGAGSRRPQGAAAARDESHSRSGCRPQRLWRIDSEMPYAERRWAGWRNWQTQRA